MYLGSDGPFLAILYYVNHDTNEVHQHINNKILYMYLKL